MGGYEIYAITGIDGDQRAGEHLFESFLDFVHFLPYDSDISFKENANGLFTRICGRNPVQGVRQAGDISTLLQF